jgi:hypothetical protein
MACQRIDKSESRSHLSCAGRGVRLVRLVHQLLSGNSQISQGGVLPTWLSNDLSSCPEGAEVSMILITGASGNVGKEVLKQIAQSGVRVRAAFQSVTKGS